MQRTQSKTILNFEVKDQILIEKMTEKISKLV